jgi:hypothetical protein
MFQNKSKRTQRTENNATQSETILVTVKCILQVVYSTSPLIGGFKSLKTPAKCKRVTAKYRPYGRKGLMETKTRETGYLTYTIND